MMENIDKMAQGCGCVSISPRPAPLDHRPIVTNCRGLSGLIRGRGFILSLVTKF